MRPRAGKPIAVGLAFIGFAAVTINKPFGGAIRASHRPPLVKSGFDTGFNAIGLAPEELKRDGIPHHSEKMSAL